MEKSTLVFLKDLAANNDRDWFQAHKARYTAARADMVAFVDPLIQAMSAFDKQLAQVDAEKTLFRIYRDTRFSHDKTPYKTHFGASITHSLAGYYLHVEPGGSFLAGGVRVLEKDQLKAMRQEIVAEPKAFSRAIGSAAFKEHFGGLLMDDQLKRVPLGFDKEHPLADYLRLKGFVAVHPLKDKELFAADAPVRFAERFSALKPLVDFIGTALA